MGSHAEDHHGRTYAAWADAEIPHVYSDATMLARSAILPGDGWEWTRRVWSVHRDNTTGETFATLTLLAKDRGWMHVKHVSAESNPGDTDIPPAMLAMIDPPTNDYGREWYAAATGKAAA